MTLLLWPWLVETYGLWGAIVAALLVALLVFSWLLTPLLVGLLYYRVHTLEQQVQELMLFKGDLSRQQKVERLRRDKERTHHRKR